MGVEKHLAAVESSSTARLNKSHSVDIYRPPALRRSNIEAAGALSIDSTTNRSNSKSAGQPPTSSTQRNEIDGIAVNANGQQRHQQQTRRERRPDRAVYIPRARRSQTTPPAVAANNTDQQQSTNQLATESVLTEVPLNTGCVLATDTEENSKSSSISCSTNNRKTKDRSSTINSNHRIKEGVPMKTSSVENRTETITFTKSNGTINSSIDLLQQPQEQRAIISQNFDFALSSNSDICAINENKAASDSVNSLLDCGNTDLSSTIHSSQSQTSISDLSTNFATIIYNKQIANMSVNDIDGDKNTELPFHNSSNLRIEDAVAGEKAHKCDIDAQELRRASKEMNRSNRRIMKQTFVSDVLEIPEKAVINTNPFVNTKLETKDDINDDDGDVDEEEDDWDTMYDESGECLDPKIIQELTASVGKVKIELPKMDYSAYLTKQSILKDEEFPHVLEVSNFPVEFKNHDLLMVFSQYKESGFDIKWVDDTHALAVFSSSRIAAEVLAMGHPFVVVKPLAEATVESRLKAKKCSTSLQPYRPRPETCAALARRLVTGALGVRLKTAAAERENEKRVLREAKERKLLAAKQRDEAWES